MQEKILSMFCLIGKSFNSGWETTDPIFPLVYVRMWLICLELSFSAEEKYAFSEKCLVTTD